MNAQNGKQQDQQAPGGKNQEQARQQSDGQKQQPSGQQQAQGGQGRQYGEGNYEAAKKYNAGVKDHVEHHDVEGDARRAAPRNAGEAREMEEAERIGRSKSRGEGGSPDGESGQDLKKAP